MVYNLEVKSNTLYNKYTFSQQNHINNKFYIFQILKFPKSYNDISPVSCLPLIDYTRA